MRYKRSYRRYKQSTRVIRMKFQSFMDISTSASSMQIITISAGGKEILRRLAPQFGAYKYYRIGNISAKLVPASSLPVDPTGLSYEAGENTVDPRDQLTPGMMRITNGEDVFENISGLSAEKQHALYNNMLLDPRWFKWMLQSGVKRHATPRYWQIGQLHQDKWPGIIVNEPVHVGGQLVGTKNVDHAITGASSAALAEASYISDGSSDKGFFQVGHRGILGWLPTDGLADIPGLGVSPTVASPPEIECMKIILPKAYKTRYYYRLYISETVFFKEPIVNFGITYDVPNVGERSLRPLDVFHDISAPVPVLPSTDRTPSFPTDSQTGGNYGDS